MTPAQELPDHIFRTRLSAEVLEDLWFGCFGCFALCFVVLFVFFLGGRAGEGCLCLEAFGGREKKTSYNTKTANHLEN